MKLVSNIKSNHWSALSELFSEADQAILVSPFLADDFSGFFSEIIKHSSIKQITLITTLPNKVEECLFKANSLPSFIDSCKQANVEYSIYINNKLHGKIYFARVKNNNKKGIITSANLTDNGLRRNHEWGILVEDLALLDQLYKEIFSIKDLYSIDTDEVLKLMIKADEYYSKNKPVANATPIDISDILNKKYFDDNEDCNYFLKPIGVSDNPFTKGRVVSSTLHFSKRRPRAVKINDILICYGVGPTNLLGYFKVLTEPQYDIDNDRWPWYVESENLSESFSEKWWNYDTEINKLCAKYVKMYPNDCVTYVGGRTLGALNFGSDKIQLTDTFAKYLINIINQSI